MMRLVHIIGVVLDHKPLPHRAVHLMVADLLFTSRHQRRPRLVGKGPAEFSDLITLPGVDRLYRPAVNVVAHVLRQSYLRL